MSRLITRREPGHCNCKGEFLIFLIMLSVVEIVYLSANYLVYGTLQPTVGWFGFVIIMVFWWYFVDMLWEWTYGIYDKFFKKNTKAHYE